MKLQSKVVLCSQEKEVSAWLDTFNINAKFSPFSNKRSKFFIGYMMF